VWWAGAAITIDKKSLEGLPGQRLLVDRANRRLIAAAPSGVWLFGLDGSVGDRLPLSADGAALSADGARIAVWSAGEKARKVTVAEAQRSETLHTLTVDKGNIDAALFVGEQLAVRYHQKKRLALFDGRGKQLQRVQAKDLGERGHAVDELFALLGGDLLAFTPFPKGMTMLVGWDAQLRGQWKLERFYIGGASALADHGDRVLFSHSRDSTRLLRLTRAR